jgi:uncharacterized membrane protein HdeD (DUF308 family)
MRIGRYILGGLEENEVVENRRWYIFEGILFVIAGLLAAALPFATALGINILIGALLAFSGVFQLALFLKDRKKWLQFFSGLLSFATGCLMLFYPVAGLMALSVMVGIFLIFEGGLEITMASVLRPIANSGWLMSSGFLAIFLGALSLMFFPSAGLIYLALAVALNLAFYGVSLLMLAWTAGKNRRGKFGRHDMKHA